MKTTAPVATSAPPIAKEMFEAVAALRASSECL
jgi:hypothetical protein